METKQFISMLFYIFYAQFQKLTDYINGRDEVYADCVFVLGHLFENFSEEDR